MRNFPSRTPSSAGHSYQPVGQMSKNQITLTATSIAANVSTQALVTLLGNGEQDISQAVLSQASTLVINNVHDLAEYLNELLKVESGAHSIYTAMEKMSGPFYLAWIILDLLELGALSLSMSILILISMVGIGVYSYRSASTQMQEEREQDKRFFYYKLLQLIAGEEIKRRLNTELNDVDPTSMEFSISLTDFKQSPVSVSKRASVDITVFSATILFTSYFWGASSILAIAKLTAVSSLLLGPWGIAIGVAACVIISFSLGYCHYQAQKKSAMIKILKDDFGSAVQGVRNDVKELQDQAARRDNEIKIQEGVKAGIQQYVSAQSAYIGVGRKVQKNKLRPSDIRRLRVWDRREAQQGSLGQNFKPS